MPRTEQLSARYEGIEKHLGWTKCRLPYAEIGQSKEMIRNEDCYLYGNDGAKNKNKQYYIIMKIL
jgi:hypothetical protein